MVLYRKDAKGAKVYAEKEFTYPEQPLQMHTSPNATFLCVLEVKPSAKTFCVLCSL